VQLIYYFKDEMVFRFVLKFCISRLIEYLLSDNKSGYNSAKGNIILMYEYKQNDHDSYNDNYSDNCGFTYSIFYQDRP